LEESRPDFLVALKSFFSGEGDGDPTYFESFSRLAGSDEVSGLLKGLERGDGEVELPKGLFD
jgi:hypothetical protein